MDYIRHYNSPLGGITLASDGEALVGLWFNRQKHYADTLDAVHQERDLAVFRDACIWLDMYFDGRKPDFTPRLNMRTTPFRRTVWKMLLSIPYGKTSTYGEIARELAWRNGLSSMSAQAVGGAVGHNSISLIVPCHRVVGASGSLTGYAGGLEIKRRLLELEGIKY